MQMIEPWEKKIFHFHHIFFDSFEKYFLCLGSLNNPEIGGIEWTREGGDIREVKMAKLSIKEKDDEREHTFISS